MLIPGGHLLNFHNFQQEEFYFATKHVPKQDFNCLLKVSLKYLENSVSMKFS